MILDTTFLLDLKDGDQAAFEAAIDAYDRGVVQRVAIPTVMELHYGAAFTRSTDEARRVRNLLLMYPLVAIDADLARRAGELLAEVDRRMGGDSGVDNADGVIAAVADQFDESVMTRNVDDFEALGVQTISY